MTEQTDTYALSRRQRGDLTWLEMAPPDATRETPTLIVLHGLGSAKERMLHILYACARQGVRALAPDLVWHGEREGAALRDARMTEDYFGSLFQVVGGTVENIATLLDEYQLPQAAVHGISLGGFATFAALLIEPRLTVGCVALGSPDWLGLARANGLSESNPMYAAIAQFSPLEQAAKAYPPRPLLLLHGEWDDVVPPQGSVALYERLQPVYQDNPERLKLVRYPELGHVYTDDMMQRTIAWTKRFL